ncbi:MAG TPA: GNAT family N-acetyltransferase, partial [Candidatus Binatus sp.]|nr:GNAT family N-acetyltransferase [Candidatus Binatus sp.]
GAFATGRRLAYFNAIIVLERAAGGDVVRAGEWLRGQGLQLSARVREDVEDDDVRGALSSLGLGRAARSEPGMVLHPLAPVPALPPGLRIETATRATMDRWYQASTVAWELDDAAADRLPDSVPPHVADDPEVRLFAGYLDGAPVATSLAVRANDVVGVFAVATTVGSRGRGLGTALTWAAVEAGRGWGCRAAALQASEMGEPVYRRMGFETATRYVTWERATAPGDTDAPHGW